MVYTVVATAAAFLLGLRAGIAIGRRNAIRMMESRESSRRW